MKFSYSRISLYKECPKKFFYKYIEKSIPTTNSPVFEKGKFIHALLETYPNLPAYEFEFEDTRANILNYIKLVFDLCKSDARMKKIMSTCLFKEKQFYLDKDMSNCEEPDQLVNGIIDFVGRIGNTILLVDWKTGQTQKYASELQLRLYAIWAFNEFPEINSVKGMFYFVEQNKTILIEYKREQLASMKEFFQTFISNILKDSDHKKKPSENCQYCPKHKECKPYNVQTKGKQNAKNV